MSQEVYITSFGIVSSIGIGSEATLKSLVNTQSGVKSLKYLKTKHTDIPCAEVPLSDDEMRAQLGIASHEIVTRVTLMGLMAAKEAWDKAALGNAKSLGLRIGLLNGTTVGGMDTSELYYKDFINPDTNLHSEYINAHDCGACTEDIADRLGRFDYVSTTSTACSSALNTIILAANLVKCGILDCVIAGGAECLTKFHLNGFNTLMILDREQCRPFDAARAGLNLGEGAAYVVIENEKSIQLRQMQPIAKVSGWGNACDAYHQTASSPEGLGASMAIQQALAMSGLHPEMIDYINAHGTGTQNNDDSEGQAIMTVFGDNVPPISSTKSYTGHTTSAAGAVETAISLLAMQHRFIPPSLSFKNRIEALSFTPVRELVKDVEINHILNNSFGFGGNSSSIIFSKVK